MQNQNTETPVIQNKNEESMPFVNEECGDTMWDEVLAEVESNQSKVKELLQFNF